MSRIALIDPFGLVADELREALGRKKELWTEVALLTGEEQEVGTLSELGDAAVLVTELRTDELGSFDAVCLCGPWETSRKILARVPAGTTAIVLSPDAPPDAGRAAVAGVDLPEAANGGPILSPPAGVVLLATVLHALPPIAWAAATLLEPASLREKAGLDELFDQTRALLAFKPVPRELLDFQRTFNVRAVGRGSTLGGHLAAVLPGTAADVSIQVLEPGVFHGFGLALTARLAEAADVETLRAALLAHPLIDGADEPELLGPVDAAGRDDILLGPVEVGEDGRTVRLWAVMDGLTVGSAGNVVRILESLALPVH